MLSLSGYQHIELVHEGVKNVIHRALRESDSTLVIVKTPKASHPTLEEITRLRHEYKILQHLDIEGIIKPVSLENYNNGFALIIENFLGESIKTFINAYKIEIRDFINLAIQLASSLGELHQKQVIHKDINPQNILINCKNKQIIIIDFSISSRLSRENQRISNPTLIEGSLAYMSPEQTGRMNRSIDYRTDLYSLGVTFYEMLAGVLPFSSTDPLELVHCHIAKQPVPPHQLNPQIPPAISSIVLKLLAKNAEDRYQSAFGLKVDLEECLAQLQATGCIKDFIPGQRDKSGQFLIPQKLYGRETEVADLMNAFERVSGRRGGFNPDICPTTSQFDKPARTPSVVKNNGQRTTDNGQRTTDKIEMMLVSGYSGIGKSSLVHEVHKPIVAARGYFIAGKFDQFKRNIPYAALIQAFSELIRQLLTESSEQIALWKEKLLAALGQNGQVIVDVIPEVELIVGSVPSVPQLGPTESQNRFNRVFKQFIHVFTQEHPLVLFLDDLQWADSASLKLIQLLMTDPDSQYLLMIGAYRDNEVSPTHPLIQTLEQIQYSGAIVNNIILRPLDIGNVSQLVADTLHEETDLRNPVSPTNRVFELAELVYNKTQGNPFFLTQLLQTLHAEKLLHFDFNEGRWLWDIKQIQAIGITDYNVVELVARNIQKLSQETQQVLKLAACIGNQFNLDVLTIVNEKSLFSTADDLWEALQAGLILPLSNAYKIPLVFDSEEMVIEDWELGTVQGSFQSPTLSYPPIPQRHRGGVNHQSPISYKFLHDRVQQAAYSLIPEEQKKATHLKIGQLLLQKTEQDALEENIFDIVNQLNIGVELIGDRSEKDELAKLNLMAGQKAKAAMAYEAAVRSLNVGLGLLPESSWQSEYELTLALYVETAEAEYLNTNFERAAALVEVVLQQATTLLDKVRVYELKVQFYIAQNQQIKALDTGLQALEILGVSLSQAPSNSHERVNLPELIDLENLPVMTDPYKLAAMRLIKAIVNPVYCAKPELLPQVILTMVNLCIEHGHSALAAYAYSWYSLLLCGAGEFDTGYHSGQLSLKLLEQFNARELKCLVLMVFNNFIRHWKEHSREALASFQEGIQIGLETGDLENVAYCILEYHSHLFLTGEPIESAEEKQANTIDILLKLKQEYALYQARVWHQTTLNLQGLAPEKYRLIGSSCDESKLIPILSEANNYISLFTVYLAKSIISYLFKNYDQAVGNARLALEHGSSVIGLVSVTAHNLYYSLALLAHYSQVETSEQQRYLELVEANQEKMKHWAEHAPMNYQHKYELVEAEKARVLGQIVEAMEYYDRAIQGAKEQGYIQEEALANELAAEFYLACGREKVAKTYMTEAYYGYIRWGAVAKVNDLDERYPQLIFRTLRSETTGTETTRTNTSTTSGHKQFLDITTIVKASQALSSEIVLSSLLEKLMKIVMENAGAQRGCLLTKQDDRWVIEAEGLLANDNLTVLQSIPIESSQNLSLSIINYVEKTKKNLVLDCAYTDPIFANDPYIAANQLKSILCLPIIHQGKLTGTLILENNLNTGVFTTERVDVLTLLIAQASISIENARLYQREQEKSQQLQQSLQKLKQTQAQLVQTEKISSLGQLVAGVAHEVNNPVSFISGNLYHASGYVQDLLNLVNLYQQYFPNPPAEIQACVEEIELDYLIEDLPKMLNSMQVGTDRISEIMRSLRNFSRVDEAEKKPVDIHSGLESTLMILQHRLKAKPERPAIQVVKEYGNLPPVECYAGQLNQVFMNLLANGIDAIDEYNSNRSYKEIERHPNCIYIKTETINADWVAIHIADNGSGMTEEVKKRLFDPFFTTKPVGKGTGLGLSISYRIVVEKHGGQLRCVSALGQGTEFIIEIPIAAIAPTSHKSNSVAELESQ